MSDTAAKTAPPRPKTIDFASLAALAQVVFGLVYLIAVWVSTGPLTELIKRNATESFNDWLKTQNLNSVTAYLAKIKTTPDLATGDHAQPLCSVEGVQGVITNCVDAVNSLAAFRKQTSIMVGLVSVMIVLLVVSFRRGSGASRWIYVALSLLGAWLGYVGSPLLINYAWGEWPKTIGVPVTLAAICSVIAIVLLMWKSSALWFRDMKPFRPQPAARSAAGGGGAPRKGLLGSLLAPPAPRPAASSTPAASARSGSESASGDVSLGKAKGKGRNDQAAIAKGAELARQRQKASKAKSRGTGDGR